MALKNMIFCIALVCLLLACTTRKSIVILLPDHEGRVGAVSVKGKSGSQVMDQPYHMIQIEDTKESPSIPQKMDPEKVSGMFSEALDVLPGIPVRFIFYFERDSTVFTEDSEKRLSEVIDYIKKHKSRDISLTAHTDRTASKEYNQSLSLKRLQFVTRLLESNGVDPDTLEASYHGEANPLVKTKDEVAEPLNRRVEVIIK